MQYIPIGRITNVHGIKGALKIKTDSDFKATRYQSGRRLYIENQPAPIAVTVKSYFEKKGFDIVRFEEFETVNQVEIFKGRNLLVHESDREALLDDEFYYDDLITKSVYIKNQEIGVVKEVREFPQAAMLVIETPSQKRVLVPFLKRFVTSVKDGRIDLVDDAEELL